MMENRSIEDQIETLRGVITRLCESNLDKGTLIFAINAIMNDQPEYVVDILSVELSSILSLAQKSRP